MNVDRRAEISERHRGALDMPAGASLAPRAVPTRLAGLRAFPKREVCLVLLVFGWVDARSRQQRVLRAVRELAVVILRADAIVHVRPFAQIRRRFVREALVDEALD